MAASKKKSEPGLTGIQGEPGTVIVQAGKATEQDAGAQPSPEEAIDRAHRVKSLFKLTEDLDFSVGQKVGFGLGGLFMVASLIAAVLVAVQGGPTPWGIVLACGLLFLFALALVIAIYFTSVDDRNARRAFLQHAEIEETLKGTDPLPTLRELLQLNRQEMSTYHLLTKEQARRSFSNSLVAMWLGFLILAGSVALVAWPNIVDSGTKLTVAAIGTVGTIVSGFIARTFLKQHSLAITQLNRFFNQPLVSSYLLTAERVALALDEPARAAALVQVITRALESAIADREPKA